MPGSTFSKSLHTFITRSSTSALSKYVAVAVFAYYVFREDLNALRIAGIGFICIGTVLIAQSGRERPAEKIAQANQTTIQTSELTR